jgi:glucose-6-phosphate isomerase
MKMLRIKVDFNYAMSAFVEGGLDDAALETYREKARMGLSRLLMMVDEGKAGFVQLPTQDTSAMKKFAKEVSGKFNDLIVIGIGGSSLGVETLCNALLPFGHNTRSFAERGGFPRVWVADNVDPSKISSILSECHPEDTMVCVITKSGSTVETAANFNIIYEWLKSGVKDIKKHICAITDPEKGSLRAMTAKEGFISFPVQPNVGGRFSVLSPVGLLPAAMLGMDIDKLLEGAGSITKDKYERIITLSCIYMYFMDKGKNINVLMPYSSRLSSFADWFCQLWGESLGKRFDKNGKEVLFGTTPLKSVGTIDQHSQVQLFKEGPKDKIVSFIEVRKHEKDKKILSAYEDYAYLDGHTLGELCNIELLATEAALKNTGKPSLKISLDSLDEYTLGALFMLWQYIVPVVGLACDIDPFDQPGVEEGKNYAYGLLGRKGYDDMKKKFEEIFEKRDDFTV